MSRLLASAATILLFSMTGRAADLKEVRTVYLLQMSNGLDQYLAIGLTTGNVMQVVVDPQKADAILTDHLGHALETKLDDLYGVKPKAEAAPNANPNAPQTFARVEGGARSRGTIFLVDRKTREVLWSDYEKTKNNGPDEIRKSADRVAQKLAKATAGK